MTGREVVELVKQNIGVPWSDQSYRDTFKFGDPDAPVKGIATTMMVTFGMLKRANEAGLNMVVAHEPTFWNDRDETKDLLNESSVQGIRPTTCGRMAWSSGGSTTTCTPCSRTIPWSDR